MKAWLFNVLVAVLAYLLLRPLRMATFAAQDGLSWLVSATVTISNGTALSPAVDLQGYNLVGIAMPAAWTAANITFQGSADNNNFFDLYDSGSEINLASAAASRYIALNPTQFAAVRYLKVRSGTSAVPLNQGADRVVTLILRGL